HHLAAFLHIIKQLSEVLARLSDTCSSHVSIVSHVALYGLPATSSVDRRQRRGRRGWRTAAGRLRTSGSPRSRSGERFHSTGFLDLRLWEFPHSGQRSAYERGGDSESMGGQEIETWLQRWEIPHLASLNENTKRPADNKTPCFSDLATDPLVYDQEVGANR